jgi:hypothetical protein
VDWELYGSDRCSVLVLTGVLKFFFDRLRQEVPKIGQLAQNWKPTLENDKESSSSIGNRAGSGTPKKGQGTGSQPRAEGDEMVIAIANGNRASNGKIAEWTVRLVELV